MSEIIAIQTTGLVKRYGDITAVDEVDLIIERGATVGLVGLPGSGRSTLLRMLAGVLRPDAGSSVLDGVEVWPEPFQARRQVGFVSQEPRHFEDLTLTEVLEFAGLLKSVPAETIATRTAGLLGALGLTARAGVLTSRVTSAERRQLALACALVHAPAVLLLDDALRSLDPEQSARVTDLVGRYNSAGGTVVVAGDTAIRALPCQRYLALGQGRIVAEGNRGSLAALGHWPTSTTPDEGSSEAWLSPSSASI